MATTIVNPTEFEYAGGTVAREQVSLFRDSLRRLRRNRLALGAAVYLILLVVVCLVSIVWTLVKPTARGPSAGYGLPSGAHRRGCDDLGRDSLSRLMVVTQVSLAVVLPTS